MASYNFYDNETLPWRNRYLSVSDSIRNDAPLAQSLALWREVFYSDTNLPAEATMANLVNDLRALVPMTPRITCPQYRLFVSHRRIDKDFALRIAQLANENGFEFWLDVLDPSLTALPALTQLTPGQLALLTACIIEMGLVNSTHVLAVMTKDSKGSEWIPYEYGRVRKVGNLDNTACWEYQDPKVPPFVLPDYMFLGAITHSEVKIKNWLNLFYNPAFNCPPIAWAWPNEKPPRLP